MSSKLNFRLLDALNIPNEEPSTQETLEDPTEELSDEDFKKNIPAMSNDKLCEIIVCFRYLGLMENESVLAMEELAGRRTNGEIFEYEKRIDDLAVDLPSINLDIQKMLKSFRI